MGATWPPVEIRRLGPWTLRRGAGGGNRTEAATLDGPLVDPAPVEAAMRDWGQPSLFMVRPGDDALDAALEARGYARRDATLLLETPAAALPEERRETAIDCDGPLACMAPIWAAGGIGSARLAVMERAPRPKTWLLGRLGDRPVACAFVALHEGVAMMHALEVEAAARGAGLGALLTRAAATWARDRGAGRLALAVTEANGPARALYARLGFVETARYHYRAAQAAEASSGGGGRPGASRR